MKSFEKFNVSYDRSELSEIPDDPAERSIQRELANEVLALWSTVTNMLFSYVSESSNFQD